MTVVILGQSNAEKEKLGPVICKLAGEKYGTATLAPVSKPEAQNITFYKYETPDRIYTLADSAIHTDLVNGLTDGTIKPDAAVLVVHGEVGTTGQIRNQLLTAHNLDIPIDIIFMISGVLADDPADTLSLVEEEIRGVLFDYEFEGFECEVFRTAYSEPDTNGDELVEAWRDAALKLINALEERYSILRMMS